MKLRLANTFGAFGYVSLLLQWLWIAVLISVPLLQNQTVKDLFLPQHTEQTTATTSTSVPEPIAIIFMVLAVVFALTVTIYAVVAIPRTIGKASKKVITRGTDAIIPKITHHKPISKKQKKRLYEYISWAMKISLWALPILALLIPVDSSIELQQSVVVLAGLFLAACTAIWFGCQFLTMKLADLNPRDIW